MLPYDPTLILRVLITTITVATGVGLVASGIAVGVIVGKGLASPLVSTQLVLQSKATIAVNRLIVSGELPLFSDPVDTMKAFLASLNGVLKDKFGSDLKAVQLLSFSATPIPSINTPKQSSAENSDSFHFLDGDTSDNPTTTTTTTRSGMPSERATTLSLATCKKLSSIGKQCCRDITGENSCNSNMTTVEICDRGNCINMTATLKNCSCSKNPSDQCDDGDSSVLKCFALSSTDNGPNRTDTTTTTASSTETGTSTKCSTSQNGVTQPSIVSANLTLFFSNDKSSTISIETIFDALKQFKPLITLKTSCSEPSTRSSSFNASLSKIQPPAPASINLATVLSQPSIPPALITLIRSEAVAAEQVFNSTLTTTVAPSPPAMG